MRQVGTIVATFWNDKRPVSLMSTNASPEMGTAMCRTKEGPQQKEIPMPVLYYNDYIAGVDWNDQLQTYAVVVLLLV